MSSLPSLLVLALATPGAAGAVPPAGPAPALRRALPDELAELVSRLELLRDDADEELVASIGALGTPAAAQALLQLYPRFASLWMRRAVLEALAGFEGVEGAELPALTHLSGVAQGRGPALLRRTAVEGLGRCAGLGRAYLAELVEAPAADWVRERALELFIAGGGPADEPFYRELLATGGAGEPPEEPKRRRRRGDDPEPPRVAAGLESLRRIAFRVLAAGFEEEQLVALFEDDESQRLQIDALLELHRRGLEVAEDLAWELVDAHVRRPTDRAVAARILLERLGAEAADTLVGMARKSATPAGLRDALANLLADVEDAKVRRNLARLLGKGKPDQRIFALRACRRHTEPKTVERLLDGLEEKDAGVRAAALEIAAERGFVQALPLLEEQLAECEEPAEQRALLEAVHALRGPEPAWLARLATYSGAEDRALRNAALRLVIEADAVGHRALLEEALGHPDWSTRLVAVEALGRLADGPAVAAIVARLPEQEGRPLTAFTEALWRLTGQPFGRRAAAWSAWWADQVASGDAAGFEPIGAEELARLEAEATERRLRQVTLTADGRLAQRSEEPEFFGLAILSRRVAFVIDLSGSMAEPLRGDEFADPGELRLAVAKRELERALTALERTARFQIIVFSFGAMPWRGELAQATPETIEEVHEFVRRLGAGGGTNLYAGLEMAFADPEVDTIVVLSDGEPSTGAVVEPHALRRVVREWNADRGVIVHTVSIGGNLQILEWLAEDHGGTYLEFQ